MSCDELERVSAFAASNPAFQSPNGKAHFVNEFVDAYRACHNSDDSLGPVSVEAEADLIYARMGLLPLALPNNTQATIQEALIQAGSGKGKLTSTTGERTTKDHTAQTGADPVMLFKGQFVHEVEDVRISGAGINFVFKRTYKNQVIFNGPLGFNWTHNFHIWLRVSGQIIYRSSGDLREEPFVRHPKFDEANQLPRDFDYWMPPDGVHGVIFAENNSFVLRQPDGSRQIFVPDPSHSFLHRLSRMEDRFGNYLELTYSEDGQLRQIEINHPKRLVELHYDSQRRICSIRDFADRKWSYQYDSHGDLISVTSPATDRHKCGLTVSYDYSSAFQSGSLRHNLLRIIDAAGQIYLETEYGTSRGLLNFNRVVRQREGGGEYLFEYENIDEVFEFDYPDEQRPSHRTVLIERNGQPQSHIYNKFGNLLRREQCVIENGLPRKLVEQYRYDRDGNVVSSLTPEGVFTQHLFGRDYFVRRHGLTGNGEVATGQLTWRERQTFARILSTVRRARYSAFDEFVMTPSEWGSFPDVLAPNVDRSQDVIIKMTYEAEFGQVLSVSDPRYTNSANPDAQIADEHPRHEETRTKYTYAGPNRLLTRIEHPTIAILPDGTAGAEIVERFTKPDPQMLNAEVPAYDSNGRLQRSTNAAGVVTQLNYFDDPLKLSFGHLRQTVVDPGGLNISVEHEVDNLGRVIATHLPKSIGAADGRYITHSVYNNLDQVIETRAATPFGFRAQRFYDRTGKLERETRELKDENGQPHLGGTEVSTYCYDEEFNLVRTTIGGSDRADHLVTRHKYDCAGNRILTTLPNGNQARTRYDERQLPVTQIAGAGTSDAATTRTEYDGDARIRRSYDARGNATTYRFDTFGRVMSVVDALGHVTRTNYDKAGNVTCVRKFEKRENGYFLIARSETVYDELNRPTHSGVNRFADPIGPLLQLGDLDNAHLNSPGPGELLVTTTVYDANSRVIKIIDPLSRETTTQYDNLDRAILVTDALGNETRNQYDEHSNLVRVDQRDLERNDNGDVIGERHFASSYDYDELDRRISSTNTLGSTSQVAYDSRGNAVRQIDALGNENRATFDIFNRLVASTQYLTANGLGPVAANAVPVTTVQGYDRNGNLTAVVDALGRTTRYQYDALDRRRSITYPDQSQMLTSYDRVGNIVRTRDSNGLQRIHTVDALNRTTRIDVDASGLLDGLRVAGATFESYEYDGMSRQIVAGNDFATCSYRLNSLSWPLTETIQYRLDEAPLEMPFVIAREFDNAGALIRLTYPNGRRLRFDRDGLDRLQRIQNLSNGIGFRGDPAQAEDRLIAQMAYAGRQRTRCRFGNGARTSYHHDAAGRVIEFAPANPNGSLLTIQYLFDAANNVRVRNDIVAAGPRTERFAYDSLYRLAHEFKPDTTETFDLASFGPRSVALPSPIPDRQLNMTNLIGSLEIPQSPHTYDYDLVGNREVERESGGNTINYEPNELDQYETRNGTDYSYDLNGNLKDDQQQFHTYDSLNRLVQVSTDEAGAHEVAGYWHDALGRRILERTGGSVTQLVCDGDDVIAEYRDGDLLAQYVFDDGIDRPLHVASGGSEHWYHVDLVGSVRLLTDANGDPSANYRYAPFGELTESTGDATFNPWRYTARRFDSALRTYDHRARQYDPAVGRFVQRDPAGMRDGTNRLAYTMNNPMGFRDPLGMSRRESEQGHATNGALARSAVGAADAALVPRSPDGAALRGQLNLWTKPEARKRAYDLAKAGIGYADFQTKGFAKAKLAEAALYSEYKLGPNGKFTGQGEIEYRKIWDRLSLWNASRAAASGEGFVSQNPKGELATLYPDSTQVKELKAGATFGTLRGLAGAVGPVLDVRAAASGDMPIEFMIPNVIVASVEGTGAFTYSVGAITSNGAAMSTGTRLMRFGGAMSLPLTGAAITIGAYRNDPSIQQHANAFGDAMGGETVPIWGGLMAASHAVSESAYKGTKSVFVSAGTGIGKGAGFVYVKSSKFVESRDWKKTARFLGVPFL